MVCFEGMILICEIKDPKIKFIDSEMESRGAVRAVLFDENNLVPILFVSKKNYHKLPGGGIDNSESRKNALIRECLEETGSQIKISGEVGKTVEYYHQAHNIKQTSYCYLGEVKLKGEPDFTKNEIKNEFQLIWVSIDEAIDRFRNDEDSVVKKRDLLFLEKARELKKKKYI